MSTTAVTADSGSPTQDKLEWVSPKISLMETKNTDDKLPAYYESVRLHDMHYGTSS
jgi:hypothetical protein